MRLSAEERQHYAQHGYVVRNAVFGPERLDALRAAAEDVAARVAECAAREESGPEFRLAGGHRFQLASGTLVQWEWREGSRAVRLLEPCSHLDPRFECLWQEPALTDPCRDALGCDDVAPFTSKLNLKRPGEGSEFPWHQDYPYWYARTPEHAREIVTAMLFLDAARVENGALRVLPGSHHAGPAPRDRSEPSQFLADPTRIDASHEVALEVEPGAIVFFPALLLHRSSPNASNAQRRALLLSFQPAGRPRQEALPWRPQLVHALP